jgi:DNA-binding CsgD family transcriptional regulator
MPKGMWVGMGLYEVLRGDLAAAASDEAAWPQLLTRLADLIGAREVVLGGAQGQDTPTAFAPRTDDTQKQIYFDTHHQQNALMHSMIRKAPGTVTLSDMVPENDAFQRSEFYNEWCVPQQFNHAAVLTLSTSTGWNGALVINTRDEVTSEQLAQLRELAPEVQRTVEQWQLSRHYRAAHRSTLAAFDLAGLGALLLDRQGWPLEFNATAQAMIGDGRLPLNGGRLSSLEPVSNRALTHALVQCLSQPAPGGLRVPVMGGDGVLSVLCAAFEAGPHASFGQPAIIVIVNDMQGRLRQKLGEIKQQHGLTQAEAELALAVVKTGSRKAAAMLRGVSDATARAQLSSIFDKTGVRKQTDLVRLLMDGS